MSPIKISVLRVLTVSVSILLYSSVSSTNLPENYEFKAPEICPLKKAESLIYNVCEDQMKILKRELQAAQKEGKLLLVKVGATWCPWCVSMKELFESKKIFGFKDDGFNYVQKMRYVSIAVSTKKGKDIIPVQSGKDAIESLLKPVGTTYKKAIKGVPTILLLDPNNPRSIDVVDTAELEDNRNGKSHYPEKVRQALRSAYKKVSTKKKSL